MKKNGKMTPEERAQHAEAVRLRKMTDYQLVNAFRAVNDQTPEPDARLERLIEGLAAGEVKGIKGGTVYKIEAYARERGFIR